MNKVLIIEDDPPYRKIYKRKFEVSGYEVEVAENGVEGLEKMRAFKPDIVFVDLMMPKMDGFQVLDTAKSDPALQHTPMVVLTNLSTIEDARRVMQKGAVGILVKSDTEPNTIVEEAGKILANRESLAQ
ncbi:MAG TPA: response regulator [Candidatus Acidoferrum sp.]|nr:response regulator [Candidatus Acidoferrum sp.]